MRMRHWSAVLLWVVASLLIVWPALASRLVKGQAHLSPGTVMRFDPAHLSLEKGQEAWITLHIEDVRNLYGAQVRLMFNPSLIEIVDAVPGGGINIEPGDTPYPDFVVLNRADNVRGEIMYVVAQIAPRPPVSGSGVLARVRVRAKASGSTVMVFTEHLLADREAREIVNSADTCVLRVACAEVRAPVDLMLVVDRSSSMFGDLLAYEKEIADRFIALLDLTQDQVGLASFAAEAALDHGLTRDGASVRRALEALGTSRGSNLEDGVWVAQQELVGPRHVRGNAPMMVFISDGQATVGSGAAAREAARAAKQAGTRIVTIGVGGADWRLLQDIASDPSHFYYAPGLDEIPAILQRAAPVLGCSETLVRIMPPAGPVYVTDGSFRVDVMVQDAVDVGGYALEVTYNPAVMQVINVGQGAFLSSTGRVVYPMDPIVDHVAGRVTFGAVTSGEQPGASGSGRLAVITFRPRVAGASGLYMHNLRLTNPAGALLPANGEDAHVEVIEMPMPSPAPTVQTPTPSPTMPFTTIWMPLLFR